MDERAVIPPTLPRANPTISYWQDPPDAEIADWKSVTALPGEEEVVDTVIVGSGISGACVAWGLLSSSSLSAGQENGKVVMLEARQACSGATGRNGLLIFFVNYFSSSYVSTAHATAALSDCYIFVCADESHGGYLQAATQKLPPTVASFIMRLSMVPPRRRRLYDSNIKTSRIYMRSPGNIASIVTCIVEILWILSMTRDDGQRL